MQRLETYQKKPIRHSQAC